MSSAGDAILAALPRSGGEPRVCPYLMAGFPDPEGTADLLLAAEAGGGALIEVGIPHSDPLADGPTLQAAGRHALAHGMTTRLALAQVELARSRGLRVPVVCMTYLNPVAQFGLEEFCRAAVAAGVDAVLVPDLPLEEMGGLEGSASRAGLGLCTMVAPTTPDRRLALAAARATGFVYCVSRTGVTGKGDPTEGTDLLDRVRALSGRPLVLGFGVRRRSQVMALAGLADGVAVGTRIVEAATGADPAASVREVVAELCGR
ncbi:MAG: tryptophan synthase subunit alpha [Candidatus Dormibacteraeota bacterium]|nr:tryptophan synthase subunit alpha [Candidatus Dormibacteraeota bacterium]